ncbi:MAG: hypothetical protein R6U37_04845 [Dehalococcoidia bacterium]
MALGKELHPAFRGNMYTFRRKVFRIFGGFFQVYDESGRQVMHSEQASFRIREDFTVYASDVNQPLLRIKTPQMLDLGSTYYVTDMQTMESVGALRRSFFKSMFKDEWAFLDASNLEVGKLTEKSILGAMLSRFIDLVPQTYTVQTLDGFGQAVIKQHFNPFILKYTMTIFEPNPAIDRRLMIAAGILMGAIERRQE